MSLQDVFNWAATAPERPFTVTDEFNRIAGNAPGEYGSIKWGRGARIVERAIMGLGILGLTVGTGLIIAGAAPIAATSAADIVLGVCAIKVTSTAAAALTECVVKVGQALTGGKKKVGVGPGSPTPSP